MLKKCEQCGLEYDAKRSNSRHCGSKYRVTANRLSVTNVTDNSDVVTDTAENSDISVTSTLDSGSETEIGIEKHGKTYSGSDCDCGMCKNKVVNKSSKIINHGPWKSASDLKDNEINRVPIPGDDDYDGCMVYKDGAWSQN